jgi:NAD(P)-dependent dehydrogenase (short-subunit alcohol dehydrogenase family)
MEQNNYQGALQKPIGSGFNATSTASDVIKGIDLKGKIAIVTGGNTGIGLETTKTLAAAGATVIVPARDIEKAKRNLENVVNVELAVMDLMNPDSIDAFAENFLASGRPLHLLINNAGIMWVPLRRDSRGIESQLATNYLAQFRLTARLWIALKKANGARVINVSSDGHRFAPVNFEDPNFNNREYETLLGYGQSKTASNLFALELDNRAKAFNVRAYSLHPGSINGTELGRDAPIELFQQMGFCDAQGNILPEVAASLKTIPQGAATTVWCATSPNLDNIGGVYCEDSDIAELAYDSSIPGGVKPYSLDEANAKRLWELSEKLTGIEFQIIKNNTTMENVDQETKSASGLLKEYLTSVSAGNPKVTASFFAEDGYIDAPYVESFGMPSKIIGTKDIEATMQGLLQNAPNFHFTKIKILMETPTEVVAEYESEATLANGRDYKQLYMGHLTSESGKIVCHREFLNTIPFVQAFFPNGLNDLITTK